uniref:Uncharacterized protein n=1 Tax=Panagrolaimus davidi TaxID=227884 RepID=A0A914QVI3_9BILA
MVTPTDVETKDGGDGASPNRSKDDNSEDFDCFLDGEYVMDIFKTRVCSITGVSRQGSGCVIDGRHILTSKNLGFGIGDDYVIKRMDTYDSRPKCVYFTKYADLAILQLNEPVREKVPISQINFGRSHFQIGLLHTSDQSSLSISEIFMEGKHEDAVHLNGIPGSRGGYCGSPVVSKYGQLGGIVVGDVHPTEANTTLPHMIEKPCIKVMPISTIMYVLREEGFLPK